MPFQATHKYDDIINLSRPVSGHPRMELKDRAKIFSPFAALKGYEEAVQDKRKLRVNRVELSDEEKEELNRKLCRLERNQPVTIVHFVADSGTDGQGGMAEGEYIALSGTITRVDADRRALEVDGMKINFRDIIRLDCGQNKASITETDLMLTEAMRHRQI